MHAHWESESSFLSVLVILSFEVFGSGWGTSTKRNLQELICPTSLHILFVQQVEQQVLVSLNQSLGVDLTVLQLLVPITLDTLQQSRQSLLLLLTKESLLALDSLLKPEAHLVFVFLLLHLLALNLQ